MSSTTNDTPARGDVWVVNLDPTIGAEIKKPRPAVIVSSDGFGRLPIKLIAPITEWKAQFEGNLWHVRIEPDESNPKFPARNRAKLLSRLPLRAGATARFVATLGPVGPIGRRRAAVPG